MEPFSPEARRTIATALEEARSLGHDHVGSEHLLLALLRDGGSPPARVLGSLGVDLGQAREEVQALFGRQDTPTGRELPFDAHARQVIERSFQATRSTRCAQIGPGHLLVGLLGDSEGGACQVLTAMGVDPEEVQQRIRTLSP
jgi:ATP-dependent Clp protease ATP-binding subunit ClpC